jgi:anti-sigma factor RsiW
MNHQLFETWILSDEALSSDQRETLQEHLQQCESCQALSSGWSEVRNLFGAITRSEPNPGFVNRWQARLAAERMQEERRRERLESLWMFVLHASGAAVLFLFLLLQIWFAFGSPTALLFAGVYQVTAIVTAVGAVGEAVTTIVRTMLSAVPPAYLVMSAAILTLLSMLWILSLRKLMLPRRITR